MCLYVDCWIHSDKVTGIASSTSMKVPLINKSADGDDSVEHVTIQEETGGTSFVAATNSHVVILYRLP